MSLLRRYCCLLLVVCCPLSVWFVFCSASEISQYLVPPLSWSVLSARTPVNCVELLTASEAATGRAPVPWQPLVCARHPEDGAHGHVVTLFAAQALPTSGIVSWACEVIGECAGNTATRLSIGVQTSNRLAAANLHHNPLGYDQESIACGTSGEVLHCTSAYQLPGDGFFGTRHCSRVRVIIDHTMRTISFEVTHHSRDDESQAPLLYSTRDIACYGDAKAYAEATKQIGSFDPRPFLFRAWPQNGLFFPSASMTDQLGVQLTLVHEDR